MDNDKIDVLVNDEDAIELLLAINATQGLSARFTEEAKKHDPDKDHSMYCLEVVLLAQLAISGVAAIGGITALAAALINYRTAKINRENSKTPKGTPVTVVIVKGERIEVSPADTVESLAEVIQAARLAQDNKDDPKQIAGS